MSRLATTLSDERRRTLHETAARRNPLIRRIIEESIDSHGVKTTESAAALAAAGERSGLTDDDAVALAVEETRAERRR